MFNLNNIVDNQVILLEIFNLWINLLLKLGEFSLVFTDYFNWYLISETNQYISRGSKLLDQTEDLFGKSSQKNPVYHWKQDFIA
jgi:hypothetical protein